MKRKCIQSVAFFGVVLFLTICFFSVSRRTSIYGTIKAIHSSLLMMITEKEFKADFYFAGPEEKWKRVSDSLYDELIIKLDPKHEIDAPKRRDANKPLTDPWGNRLQIWYKKGHGSSCDLLVISCGPDRKSGTDDDIVSDQEAVWP